MSLVFLVEDQKLQELVLMNAKTREGPGLFETDGPSFRKVQVRFETWLSSEPKLFKDSKVLKR